MKRAEQMAKIQWVPKNYIPFNYGEYKPGLLYTGVPYSSAKEMDKFVGHDVSFYTFLTAVNNPLSVLYSEDISKYPYNGTNCKCYYGTVCSMAVNYVLGVEYPYNTSTYPNHSSFEKIDNYTIDDLRYGDIMWQKGHVFLIIDVQKNAANKVSHIVAFESRQYGTYIDHYDTETFINKCKEQNLIIYRYLDIDKQNNYVYLDSDKSVFLPKYNNDICTNRGDMVSYIENEDVHINILNSEYAYIELYKDDLLYSTKEIQGSTMIYKSLPYGDYKARLTNKKNNKKSEYTYFEIISAQSTVVPNNDGYIVELKSQNAIPEYIFTSSMTGGKNKIYPVDNSIMNIEITKASYPLIKVSYKGKYGRVSCNHYDTRL